MLKCKDNINFNLVLISKGSHKRGQVHHNIGYDFEKRDTDWALCVCVKFVLV